MSDRHAVYDLIHIDDKRHAHIIYDDLKAVYDDMRNKGYIYEDCVEAVHEEVEKWRILLEDDSIEI